MVKVFKPGRGRSLYSVEPLEARRLLSFALPTDPRIITNLDSSWKFIRMDVTNAQTVAFNDSSWGAISVPHTWNNLDGQDGGSNYYRGIGWYRRHITPDTSLAGKSLYLKFDGANLTTDLYINGTFVGEHKGGYSAFGWDISSFLTIGTDNLIAVKVNNANDPNVAPNAGDYTMDGGIYRHVNLIATNTAHVALQEFVPPDTSANPIGPTVGYWLNTPGVYLTPTNVTSTSANLSITTDLRNDGSTPQNLTVVSDVVDAAGNLVVELAGMQTVGPGANVDCLQSTVISNPHLWNGVNDPYMYSVYTSVKNGATLTDLLQQPLGFRSFSVSVNSGAILNGQAYSLHGVDFHQDRLNEGWAISDADQTQDVGLIQEMGATFVRLSHYQHPELTYDLLDQDGIAAWSEVPVNGTNSGNLPNTTTFLDNAKQQLQEMIRQEYNHPSVVVWGLFNEINDNATNRAVITALNNLAHHEDPTRLTTCASNNSPGAPIAAIPDLASFNEYYGWYNGSVTDIPGVLDSVHSSDPNQPVGISEYGAGGSIFQHQDNPPEPNNAGTFHPEEYEDLFHETYWAAMATRPFLWETTAWNMFDFAVDSRSEGDTPGRNDKGLVTYDRATKKDAFYFYKANWSTSPVLYLTSRRYTTRASSTMPVKVYANMDSVTLIVNGVTIGTLGSASAPYKVFQWSNVPLQNGTNLIQVNGTRAGQPYTDSYTLTNAAPLTHLSALAGIPFVRINFQPSSSTKISGYDPDNGLAYGVRADGLSYGWNVDNSGNTRERTSGFIGTPPDPRYARLIQMQKSGTFTWEIAVPNGTYDVHLVSGDPSFTDSTEAIDLEGKLALSGTPTTSNLWIDSIVQVTVTDGRLTLSPDSTGSNDKINFLDINSVDVTPPTATFNGQLPTVGAATFDFTITYTDASGLAASTFDSSDIRVTGPNNYNQLAQYMSVDTSGDGSPRTVTYRITAPNGRWKVSDSGTYTIAQEPNQVRDTAGNYRPTETIASINPAFPFAYILSNRLYVDFNGAPISLGAQAGNITATSGTTTLNFAPGSFADVLVTGSSTDTITLTSGSVVFTPGSSSSLSITVNAGAALTLDPTEQVNHLTIAGGQVSILPGGTSPLTLQSLSITGGNLDLTNNDLILKNGGSAGVASLFALLHSGFNSGNGYWNGNGIISSSAASDTNNFSTLGILLNTTTTDVMVKYTYYGDADLNGSVNGADYQQIDNGFGANLSGWSSGDFNYDGVVNGSDFALIDNTFNQIIARGAAPLALLTDANRQIAAGKTALPLEKNVTPVVVSPNAIAEFRHPISTPIFSDSSTSAWERYIEVDDRAGIDRLI